MKTNEIANTVGKKRFTTLVAFAVLAASVGGAWQKYYIPKHTEVENQARSLQSERQRVQNDILEMPKEYEEQKANIARYEGLLEHGFFSPQDRIDARARMDKVRADSGLRGISYDIAPVTVIKTPEYVTLTEDVVSSTIKVEMAGLSDLEMRRFLLKMNTDFGGLLNTKSITFEIGDKLNEGTLLMLSQKLPVDFVKGKAEFEWMTMQHKPVDAATPQAQAFGGTAPPAPELAMPTSTFGGEQP